MADGRTPKILLVDDDVQVLNSTARLLRLRGFDVISCDSPFAVTRMVLRHRPSVVVLDVHMPALDGTAVSNFLERGDLQPRPALVFYSGADETVLQDLVSQRRRAMYVTKSRGADALCAAIRTLSDITPTAAT